MSLRRHRHHRCRPVHRRCAALALAAVLFAGCSSEAATSGDGPTATPGTAGGETTGATIGATIGATTGAGGCAPTAIATACLTFDLTGDVTLAATAVPAGIPSALSCADWSAGGNELAGPDRFSLPFPDTAVDGKVVSVLATVAAYAGPGTYDLADLVGLGESIQLSIDDDAFESTASTTGTVVVAADGSGSLVFEGMARLGVGTDGPPALAGTVSWTCTEAS